MPDRLEGKIDVELWPVEVVRARTLDLQDLCDRSIAKPWKVAEGEEVLTSSTSNHTPFGEMLVTSTFEVALPGATDFIFVLLDQSFYSTEFFPREPLVPGEVDFWFDRELCLTIRPLHMDMQT